MCAIIRSAQLRNPDYRSAVVFGTAVEVTDEEKERGLFVISENVLPGRWQEVRPPVEKELKATTVLRVSIESASAKIKTGPPKDEPDDYALPIWAGVIPVQHSYRTADPDAELNDGIDVPQCVLTLLGVTVVK